MNTCLYIITVRMYISSTSFLTIYTVKINLPCCLIIKFHWTPTFVLSLFSLYSASTSAPLWKNMLHLHTKTVVQKRNFLLPFARYYLSHQYQQIPCASHTHARITWLISWEALRASLLGDVHTWGYSVTCWVMVSPAGHPDVSFCFYTSPPLNGCCLLLSFRC